MTGIEQGKNSKIPRPTGPTAGQKPLAEKVNNIQPADRKRKAPTFEAAPESKRAARPTRSNPAVGAPNRAAAAVRTSQNSLQFNHVAENGKPAANGPMPGEETFEDIQARSGLSEMDVLQKKMAFKRGMKPDKKVEEMVPMIKELRALGWHLMSARDKAAQDSEDWITKIHDTEGAFEREKEQWNEKRQEVEKKLDSIKTQLESAMSDRSKLSGDLTRAEAMIATRSKEVECAQQELRDIRHELEKVSRNLSDRDSKVREMEEVLRQSQSYSTTLQSYNTSLQGDLKEEKARRDEASRERDQLLGKAAELGGLVRSLEQQLPYEREQVAKLRGERELMSKDMAVLRADLDTTRQERDRLIDECARAKQEVERIRAAGGKSLENLETLNNDKATMEVQLAMQQKMLADMRRELASSKEEKAMAESSAGTRNTQITELQEQVGGLQNALTDAERRVVEGELMRRKLHNIIQELKGNIRVFCRVRPSTPAEQGNVEHDAQLAVEFPETNDILSSGVVVQAPARGDLPGPPTRHNFTFDKVFTPASSQSSIFTEISELVQSALDGHKVCIFAYGQTGSGKTYTMLGTPDAPGMIPLAMHQIFDTSRRLGAQGWTFNMQASMLEIYNEEYKDLLSRSRKGDKKHQVLHNQDGSTSVTDLTYLDVSSEEKVDALLSDAMDKRSVGCTALNEHSSRSHMVFTLKIEGSNSSTGQSVNGVLNLIDLAGSERVKDSGAAGQAMKEAQNINRSLSALGDVIVAIANKDKHVPFRNSKLTYLLQPCLGGDAKTLMFVNIAPSREFSSESLCSLRFAAKVNSCEINPRRQGTK